MTTYESGLTHLSPHASISVAYLYKNTDQLPPPEFQPVLDGEESQGTSSVASLVFTTTRLGGGDSNATEVFVTSIPQFADLMQEAQLISLARRNDIAISQALASGGTSVETASSGN